MDSGFGQTLRVLDILRLAVDDERLATWVEYLAPDPQPFIVGDDPRWDRFVSEKRPLAWETRHTFRVYAAPKDSRVVWLTRSEYQDLAVGDRSALVREQIVRRNGDRPGVGRVPTVREWSDLLDAEVLRAEADGHRFVWWPEIVKHNASEILERLVPVGRLASRHDEVQEVTWNACSDALPGAREVAGTWGPLGERSCCFSTVLQAAGAPTSGSCTDTALFESWLRTACRPTRMTDRPGTVLVWRADGKPFHAAVYIGDGWTLEQPSADWHAPRAIARTEDVIRSARYPGQYLERHLIVA